jgi:hypothetical protein
MAELGAIPSGKGVEIDVSGRYSSFMVWKRVVGFAMPEAIYFLFALIAAFGGSICSTLQPIYLGKVFDLVSTTVAKGNYDLDESMGKLTASFTFIVLLELLKGLSDFGHEKTNENLGDYVRQRVQASVWIICQYQVVMGSLICFTSRAFSTKTCSKTRLDTLIRSIHQS